MFLNHRKFLFFLLLFFSFRTLYSATFEDVEWTMKASMNKIRDDAPLVAVNDKLYVFGGTTDGFEIHDSIEEYDPKTNTWEILDIKMSRRRRSMATAVVNNKVYMVAGGDDFLTQYNLVEEFDPASNTMVTKTDIPVSRFSAMAAAIGNNIYVMGGGDHYMEGDIPRPTRKDVYMYDVTTDSWTRKSDMISPRSIAASAVVDGKIYVIGGYKYHNEYMTADGVLNSIEEYDPVTDTWTECPPMSNARVGPCAVVIDDIIYVMGGWFNGDFNNVDAYDPKRKVWTTKRDMNIGRNLCGAVVIDNKIYVAGGNQSLQVRLDFLEEGTLRIFSTDGTVSEETFENLGHDPSYIYNDLVAKGYIDLNGVIQDNFENLSDSSDIDLDITLEDKSDKIYDILDQALSVIQGVSNAYCYPSPVCFSKGDVLRFANISPDSVVRIISPAGHILKRFNADEYGYVTPWDGRTESNSSVGSGTYIVHVKAIEGDVKLFNILVIA